jgi:hypothetical protein
MLSRRAQDKCIPASHIHKRNSHVNEQALRLSWAWDMESPSLALWSSAFGRPTPPGADRRICQTSVCSAISSASSTSIPK